MLRRLFAAVIAAGCCLALTADAQAVFFTSNGDLEISFGGTNAGANPPTINLKRFGGSDGFTFTNQIDRIDGAGTGGPFGNGAFSQDSEIRTVSAYKANSAVNGSPTPISFSDGDILAVVSAIQGTISSESPTEGLFTAGRAFAIKVAPGSFTEQDPSTWTAGTIIAEYALKPQEDVFPTLIGSLIQPFPKEDTNVSAVNPLQAELTDGAFLFTEDSTDAQNNLVINGRPNFGDDFLSNVDDSSPPGLVKIDEAIFAIIQQTLEPFTLSTLETQQGFAYGAADLTAMNFFAGLAGFSDLGSDAGAATPAAVGDPIKAFASGLGSGTDDKTWNPAFPGDPFNPAAATGDFRAQLNLTTNHIGIQAVPEPTSMMLFGLGTAICGFGASRWKRKQSRDSSVAA